MVSRRFAVARNAGSLILNEEISTIGNCVLTFITEYIIDRAAVRLVVASNYEIRARTIQEIPFAPPLCDAAAPNPTLVAPSQFYPAMFKRSDNATGANSCLVNYTVI